MKGRSINVNFCTLIKHSLRLSFRHTRMFSLPLFLFFTCEARIRSNRVVCASDTPATRIRDGCVHDTVSDAAVWARYGLLSGHVGGDAFHSLDTPEIRGSLCKPLFHRKS